MYDLEPLVCIRKYRFDLHCIFCLSKILSRKTLNTHFTITTMMDVLCKKYHWFAGL